MRRITTKTAAAKDKINSLRIQKNANKAFIFRFEKMVGDAMNQGFNGADGQTRRVSNEMELEQYIREVAFPELTQLGDPNYPNNYLYGRGENHRASVFGFLNNNPPAAGIEAAVELWHQGQQDAAIDSFIQIKNQAKTNGFNNWINMMTDDRLGYLQSHPAFSYILIRQVFDKVGADKTGEPVSARADIIGHLHDMFEHSDNPQFNLSREYEKLFGKQGEKAAKKSESPWIRIPRAEEEPDRVDQNMELIHQLSQGTAWCIGSDSDTMRRSYYIGQKGQFYIYRRDGKSYCAALFYPVEEEGKGKNKTKDPNAKPPFKLVQLQSWKNGQPPPLDIADEVIDFLSRWKAGMLEIGGDHAEHCANYTAFQAAVDINRLLQTPEQLLQFCEQLRQQPEKYTLLSKENQQKQGVLQAATEGWVLKLAGAEGTRPDPAAYGTMPPVMKSLPAIRNAFFQGIRTSVSSRETCPSLSEFSNRLGGDAQKPAVRKAIEEACATRFQTDPPTDAEANDLDLLMTEELVAAIARGITNKIQNQPEYFFNIPDKIRQHEPIANHAVQAFAGVAVPFFSGNPSSRYFGMLQQLAPQLLQQQEQPIKQAITQAAPRWLQEQDRISACVEVPEFVFEAPEGVAAAERIFTAKIRSNPKNWEYIPNILRDRLIDNNAIGAAIQRDCRVFVGLSPRQQKQNLIRYIIAATQQVSANHAVFDQLPQNFRSIDHLCRSVGMTRQQMNAALQRLGKQPITGDPLIQAKLSKDISSLIWERNWVRQSPDMKRKENWPVIVQAAISHMQQNPNLVIGATSIDQFAYPIAIAPPFRERWEELKRQHDTRGMEIHQRSKQISDQLNPQRMLPVEDGQQQIEDVPAEGQPPAEQPPQGIQWQDGQMNMDVRPPLQVDPNNAQPPRRRGLPPPQASNTGWWKRMKA